jgi:anti-sigma B factor antagonist
VTTFQAQRVTGDGGVPVISVSGELDLASANTFVDEVTMSATDSKVVRLDLGGVTFMDSTGLGALIKIRNWTAGRGGSMLLVAASPAVERVLELTGMSDIFSLA